ncbi:sigma-w pathway protein ysdB [Bacillus massiliglaciei]|uniref:sigma-w pathway protein ysdB n=1 Tax=Bacillus massiliglaciei TaxID=1816693 RepID=UPI000A624537|nr:sigma-w pathway protein ysdB [Bacillus massiliglaciei]
MVWILRLLIIAILVFLLYSAIRYAMDPKRKLKRAHSQRHFFIMDDSRDVRKNFELTYKGILFEGEKYTETLHPPFTVISIFIWPQEEMAPLPLTAEDFLKIERALLEMYPAAAIDWKNPNPEKV